MVCPERGAVSVELKFTRITEARNQENWGLDGLTMWAPRKGQNLG